METQPRRWDTPEVRRACAQYRALLALQRGLPDSEKWRMGAEIREAKLRAYVEAEAAAATR